MKRKIKIAVLITLFLQFLSVTVFNKITYESYPIPIIEVTTNVDDNEIF